MVNFYACCLSYQDGKYLTSVSPNDFTECKKIVLTGPELEHGRVVACRMIWFHEPCFAEHYCVIKVCLMHALPSLIDYLTWNLLSAFMCSVFQVLFPGIAGL